MALSLRLLRWVGMVQHKISNQNVIDPSTSSRDIDFYSKNFNKKLEHKISKSVTLTARSGWCSIKLQTNI